MKCLKYALKETRQSPHLSRGRVWRQSLRPLCRCTHKNP